MNQQRQSSDLNQRLFRLMQVLAPAAALGGILSFLAVAVLGLGKADGTWMFDFYWYYVGGVCFHEGGMYDVGCVGPKMEKLTGLKVLSGLNYPPHFAPISLATTLLPLTTSLYLFMGLNIVFSAGLVWAVVQTERSSWNGRSEERPLSHWWAVLLVLGSSGLWAAVWLGQVSVLLAVCMWAAFRQIQAGNDVAGGFLLAVASIKPQMAFLLFLWVLLQGRFKVLISAAVFAALMSAAAFAKMGILPVIGGWLDAVASYQDYPVNTLGNSSIMGLPSFFAIYDISIPLPIATALTAIFLIVLRFHSKVPPFSPMALGTILLVQMVVFSRQYDSILIAPLFALFWPRKRSNLAQILFFLLALAVFCFPQQLVVRAFPFGEAAHFRTYLLIILTILFVRQMLAGQVRMYRRVDVDGMKEAAPAESSELLLR